jgi:hypothetical protein
MLAKYKPTIPTAIPCERICVGKISDKYRYCEASKNEDQKKMKRKMATLAGDVGAAELSIAHSQMSVMVMMPPRPVSMKVRRPIRSMKKAVKMLPGTG